MSYRDKYGILRDGTKPTEKRVNPPKKYDPDAPKETPTPTPKVELSDKAKAQAQVEGVSKMPVMRPGESLGDFAKRMKAWREKQKSK